MPVYQRLGNTNLTANQLVINNYTITGAGVPYVGASADVNLAQHGLTASSVSTSIINFSDGSSLSTGNVASSTGGLVPFTGATANLNLASHSFTASAISANSISSQTSSAGAIRVASLVFGDGSIQIVASTGGSGETNLGQNLLTTGSGTAGVFAQKSGITLQFKDLIAGNNIGLTESASAITISGSSAGGGIPYTGATADVNLASNSLTAAAISTNNLFAGSLRVSLTTVVNSFTFDNTMCVALCSASGGSITATLPTAMGILGQEYVVKKIDSSTNAVVLKASAGQLIDGSSAINVMTQNIALKVISDNANWSII
jgi:hypothetical protein